MNRYYTKNGAAHKTQTGPTPENFQNNPSSDKNKGRCGSG